MKGKGVGYSYIALDCTQSGIAIGFTQSNSPSFVAIAGSPSIGQGTVIRCENKGRKWYVDGELVASTSAVKGVSQITYMSMTCPVPCFTIQGNLHVSAIELES